MVRIILLFFQIVLLAACSEQSLPEERYDGVPEAGESAITEIRLSGDITSPDAELSGLAWFGDTLLLLTQYPDRFDNHLFFLTKQQLEDYLDAGSQQPLQPGRLQFEAPDLDEQKGYEGLEAIAFEGTTAFVSVEASPDGEMQAWLFKGYIDPGQNRLVLNTDKRAVIPGRAGINNFSDEALLIRDSTVYTFYEANGENVNRDPLIHLFDWNLNPAGTLSMTHLEYRLTDATGLDNQQRFWVSNYLYEGQIGKLDPATDSLFIRFGVGSTHMQYVGVERLVEFVLTDSGARFSGNAPILLQLTGESRNWEGLVRFPERGGFLLATDTHPRTILAFVRAR